ncbi:MAG: protein kinase domain-containing protein, partial [Planctomycetota bacterium]
MSSFPNQIGPYRIRREIGRGGMGVVCQAFDTRLHRDVAIKAISPDLAGDENRLARFRQEARMIAQLNHPNIVQVHQFLKHDGQLFLVLEYVPGRSLTEMIRRVGTLGVQQALAVCVQVARAMEAAHDRGIIHRDLKPGNIRVSETGTAKVLDFGIARASAVAMLRSEVGDASPGETGSQERPSGRAGTPGYMAPEQARGEPVDSRADIFSFGCVLYECLAGEPAFESLTCNDGGTEASSGHVGWSKLPPSLPEPVLTLLQRCLAHEPRERLASMREARLVLETALGERSTPSTDTTGTPVVPNNLPRSTSSFVGREQMLRDVAEHLVRSRLVTLTGSGGCGKTRLALELAQREMRRFPDGVQIAELAAVSGPDAVPAAVAAALDVMDRAHRSTTDVLSAHLADQTSLLILDTCERVLPGVSDLVQRLLQDAPRLHVLATSREPLHLPGEQAWPVPGLAVPSTEDLAASRASEAMMLFLDRARAIKPAFQLNETNADAV